MKEYYPVAQNYGIGRWGEGYFGISPEGHLTVRPDRTGAVRVDLYRLAFEIRQSGLDWPVLVRFNDILHDRVRSLIRAFDETRAALGYQGGYTPVYPIKVNQQRSVVEEIVRCGGGRVGLEAGSKPELMAVLGVAERGLATVVCNGYKDREYIRLALIGSLMVPRLYIVIEKPSELDLVIRESEALGIEPRLGVRLRLAASGAGNWQNSGGEKAKFGLSAAQVLTLVERLGRQGRLHWLQLQHSHMGSQIPNIRDIRRAMAEIARYYVELRRLGAPIAVVDVGGGLGVDYEGTGSRNYCSVNYGLHGYANEVAGMLAEIARAEGEPEPDIFTESGRALTAHHAVLIADVIERESPPASHIDTDPEHADHPLLKRLLETLDRVHLDTATEVYYDARHLVEDGQLLFEEGRLDLGIRARLELAFIEVCRRLRPTLRSSSRRHRELLDELDERLADKLFCNFSIFQSMPDVWALDQIFPVVPLHRLNEPPSASAILHDLTCDSDGCIELYVDQDGIERTLPVHERRPGEPYLLGMFMVGAYQEILGDMHNLFGDTNAVNLELTGEGGYRLLDPEQGDTVDELLSYVHFEPAALLGAYGRMLDGLGLPAEVRERHFGELAEGLKGYSYLED